MFLLGICVHMLFLCSIFDIYFKCSIVTNLTHYQPQHAALADRLVLFSVDGLRAESFVNYTTMPYLRSIANSHGRWGISHARAPTESRFGHVAMIAGFYEDPSAAVKGHIVEKKKQPVDFDSFFNRTVFTWCWGFHNILKIFVQGNITDHMFLTNLDYHNLDGFNKSNTLPMILLDEWVFDKVSLFFKNAKNYTKWYEKLKTKKISFFLHLTGTDDCGHAFTPKAMKYLATLANVDRGIKKIENIIREFYDDDGNTTFLVTSDHGMTDWGTHKTASDHETQTPYVIWGAGVQQVKMGKFDCSTLNMSLEHRMDINQVDLVPLMSTILSIPVPVNSVGQLRSDILNLSLADKAKAIYSNSRQLAYQYDKKRIDIEANVLKILYKPFKSLTKEKYDEIINYTENMIANGEYEKLINISERLMCLSLKGILYYHNYYQVYLLTLVTLAFVGWILSLLKLISEQILNTGGKPFSLKKDGLANKNNVLISIVFLGFFVLGSFLVYAQDLPGQYYIYFLLPVVLWWNVLYRYNVWLQMYALLKSNSQIFSVALHGICYILGCLILGWSLTYRWLLCIPLCGMASWPLLCSTYEKCPKSLLISWILGCIFIGVFTFMPVVGNEVNIELVILAGITWLLIVVGYMRIVLIPLCRNNEESKKEIIIAILQMIILILSLDNIYKQSKRYEFGTAVSFPYQYMTWIIAFACFFLPVLHSRRLVCRLMAINTALLTFYLLMSVVHEGFFVVILSINVFCWILIELRLTHLDKVKITQCHFGQNNLIGTSENYVTTERSINSEDFRRAFFFATYIIVSFFGTNNMVSINSYDVRWVTCFITHYDRNIIIGLIFLKTLAPFLLVACSYRAIQHLTKAPIGYSYCIVLVYASIMGIQLLFCVKNTGTWREIGSTTSHFVIVQVATLFIVLLNQAAKILTYKKFKCFV